jgi:transitional endoplasmic reticulum ATPase
MFSGEATVQALRDALRISPDNLPLRQHLAETLLGLGRFDEAEH